jgi:hypothetical protein
VLPFCVVPNHPHIALALQILQALLTPVIAGIAVYIAWQQWKVNARKLALDQYERRLRIYQRVVEMLRFVCSKFSPEIHDLMMFSSDTAEADFLFGPEIPKYIDEIYSRGVDLNTANAEYRDVFQPSPAGYDHQKIVNAMTEQKKWFVAQFSVAKEKFRKYIDVSR